MKDLPKRVLFGAIVTLLLLSCTPIASALETGAIGAMPAYPQTDNIRSQSIFIKEIEAGQSATDGLTIYNYTDVEHSVMLDIVDSSVTADGSFACKQSGDEKKLVSAWTTLDQTEILLAPKGNQTVDFTVRVPSDVGPGEYNGCVSIQDKANLPAATGGGVRLGFRSALRLSITVPGELRKELSTPQVTITRNKEGDYVVGAVSTNKGNVSLDITANAGLRSRITGKDGAVQKAEFPILNGSTNGWQFTFKRPFWGGYSKAIVSFAYNDNVKDGIGEGTQSQKKTVRAESAYFFLMPAPKALAIYAGVALLPFVLLITILVIRRRRRLRALWQLYIVQQQDTIQSLAAERRIKWKKIAKINKISSPHILQTGQKILLPPAKGQKPTKISKQEFIADDIKNSNYVSTIANQPQPEEVETPIKQSTPAVERQVVAAPKTDNSTVARRPFTYRSSMSYNPESEEPMFDWSEGGNGAELLHDTDEQSSSAPRKIAPKPATHTTKASKKPASKKITTKKSASPPKTRKSAAKKG